MSRNILETDVRRCRRWLYAQVTGKTAALLPLTVTEAGARHG